MDCKKIILFFLVLCGLNLSATHNRAGEITYKQISLLTYEVTIITYTKDSAPADRCELEILWGDGTLDTLLRTNGTPVNGCNHSGELVGNDIKKNIYIGYHTYPAIGTYIISMFDPNRNSDIANIPNSVNTPFYIESIININPDLGYNNSPTLLNPPIDEGCVGNVFIHNPSAFDIDGDSLSYSLIDCAGIGGAAVPGYMLPETFSTININPITGDFIWDYPTMQQQVNIAILIKEHRKNTSGNWIVIGQIIRDMQIDIADCNNNPPEINTIDKICIEAGQVINFNLIATDIDFDQIDISATGGPLEIIDSAYFPIPFPSPGTVSSIFNWNTNCSHIRQQPYYIVFKAEDNGYPNLVTIKTVEILIVAPSPKNPLALPIGNTIELTWNASICPQAIGYDIYKNNQFYNFNPDSCETGVPSYTGYNFIGSTLGLSNTIFIDNGNGNGLTHGLDHCYMIVATYSDDAESYASIEVCAELTRDVPIITNVNVLSTSQNTGSIEIVWSKPTEFDSISAPGPYSYNVYQSNDLFGNNLTLLQTLNGGINDTILINQNINSIATPFSYQIELTNNTIGDTFTIGNSNIASSIHLTTYGSDSKVVLNWNESTPWLNDNYTIYRYNPISTLFDSIGNTSSQSFTDFSAQNDIEYCYKIESIGSYSASGLINPLFNLSQESCATPIDTFPPCPPILNVVADCSLILNDLQWSFPDDSCSLDVAFFDLYYANSTYSEYNYITTINGDVFTYLHELENNGSLAGCYYILATDSLQNQSAKSNVICVDNCPDFELPNVFTPNNDQSNNVFKPTKNIFNESVETNIFNRWGALVYSTNDPNINWNGKHYKTGKDCPEGVYFVSSKVYEIHVDGVSFNEFSTFVHLFR